MMAYGRESPFDAMCGYVFFSCTKPNSNFFEQKFALCVTISSCRVYFLTSTLIFLTDEKAFTWVGTVSRLISKLNTCAQPYISDYDRIFGSFPFLRDFIHY